MPTGWELVGEVSVDSGTLTIVDPCYVDKGFDYEKWCDTEPIKGDIMAQPVPLSFCFLTAGGDGNYPVYAKRNKNERITAVMVDTDPVDEW